MAVYKNKASQKLAVFAVDATGAPKTGDANNISAQISKDGGGCAPTDDVHPTELDATNAKGIYLFDLAQAETNADLIVVSPVSTTSGVVLRPVIVYTEPELRTANTTQVGGAAVPSGAIPNAVAGAASGLAIVGSVMGLSAGAIDDVWDESQTGHTSASTFGKYLDAQVSAISAGSSSGGGIAASDVWAYGIRTLTDKTNYGLSTSALNEVATNTLAASTVWGYGTKTLTDKTNYGISTSAINEIMNSTLAASTVWSNPTRSLTDKTNYGLSGSALGEISASLGGIGLAASDVWNSPTRTLSDKVGFKLASDGLDTVTTTAPSSVAGNFREQITLLYRRFFGKAVMTSTDLKTYALNSSTVVTTQTLTESASVQTQNEAT
jgi:hypothetical protein